MFMGELHVDERNSWPVVSAEEMAGRFHGELIGAMPDWKRRLSEDPSRLAKLEHEVHEAFSRGADLVVAGLIARTMKQAGFDKASEQTRIITASPSRRAGSGRFGFGRSEACRRG